MTKPRQIQIRRGTATEHENFTGAVGEITMDTTNNTIRVHDGQTPGGTPLAKRSEIPQQQTLPDNYDFVVEYGGNSDNWYRKYKSGRVDIGGHYTGNAATITLPIEVANTDYEIMFTKNSDPAYWATTHLTIGSLTTTSFTVNRYGDNASMRIGWLIINAIAK